MERGAASSSRFQLSRRPDDTDRDRLAHVLLVEDSALVTDALRILLEASNRRVSVAASIADALTVGGTDPAALVLVDLTLPDGDGLALIEPLRAAGCRTFVALTGHDDASTAARCRAAGCADVLVKPVPARELIGKVAQWVDGVNDVA